MSVLLKNLSEKPAVVVEGSGKEVPVEAGATHGCAVNAGETVTIPEGKADEYPAMAIEAGQHALILTVGGVAHDVAPGATYTVRGPAEVTIELKPEDPPAEVAGDAAATK